jgi:hypothetical protein
MRNLLRELRELRAEVEALRAEVAELRARPHIVINYPPPSPTITQPAYPSLPYTITYGSTAEGPATTWNSAETPRFSGSPLHAAAGLA